MGKIIPLLLAFLGLGAGVGGGMMLRPAPQDIAEASPCGDMPTAAADHASKADDETASDDAPPNEYVKLNNQFIVPIVEEGKVQSLVIMSISLEVEAGGTGKVYAIEPKLRDGFLQVLFDHANAGGFDGTFTNSNNMDVLRMALTEVARQSLGRMVSDILIVDIVRQDS
ncbi:MAG: flagellar basal body-associated FliL family protein [Albidovulum sp.]